jgi:predicted nucleic acid-binding protein
MKVLVDTNILLRVAQPGHVSHASATAALIQLRSAERELCLVPQSIYEYWVVATRPTTVNGLGLTTADADLQVQDLLTQFTLLRDERGILSQIVRNCNAIVVAYCASSVMRGQFTSDGFSCPD